MKDLFLEQMEETANFNLFFPFHLDQEKLLGNYKFNPEYGEALHCHFFNDVLNVAYLEPLAFHLTFEDEKHYSEQEKTFLQKLQSAEAEKINKGLEIITLELEEETIEALNQYRKEKNLTIEEALVDVLHRIVDEYSQKENENESQN